jgi:FtsH-binding integral membrane protein
MVVTGVLVGTLAFIGATIPDSLEHWGSYLFAGLMALLVAQFMAPIALWFGVILPDGFVMTALDWVGIVLFSGYVIYDMNRAQRVAPTLDNAVDCSLDLYLDILNLFIRLLSIMGQKK